MLIQEMFKKPIDREIQGVIIVGQGEEANIAQELEEYVVTKELEKHFREFFSNYKKGIVGTTPKMGVWISGFFGSGKSHFLKILSYLLSNQEVNGKKALDYFVDDEKIADQMVLGDMRLAAQTPTDAILFNIDSKSEMVGKHSKDAIVSVFLKVFNEMQGFYGSVPYVADLERHLTENGQYEAFKQCFARHYGQSWEDSRRKFDFIQDTVVAVLTEMDVMSEAAARNWCEKAAEPYQISIENFARMVREYLEKKGNNHHVVFLADEVGQYIGEDTDLMLNLQTVTEELGKECKGKAWVIVTSQQDIDAVTKVKGNDFSKIQGRFDTRLSLSSANVDAVIKQRILAKNETASQMLRLLYEQKATIIKNLITFNDGIEKRLYDNETDFAAVYPFVQYQFNLLASVLTSIRTHGASGKHLSEGERSMLALFKESAMAVMTHSEGAIVPFWTFYDALEQFLDHSHKGVIIRAEASERINPAREANGFNIQVLKTLFLIKYVKEIKANLDNITSLMVSEIDEDRLVLKEKVELALRVLISQTLVQKNGDIYVFLTEEEQEISREIGKQPVETAEVIHKAAEMIFEDIFKDNKYRYPRHNGRYAFGFNQKVDDYVYKGGQGYDIGVHIITPAAGYATEDEMTFRMLSGQNKDVLVVLPNDVAFLDEIRGALRIEKYLRLNTTGGNVARFQQIQESKRVEMRQRLDNAKLYLRESLKEAAIYVNGDQALIGSKDVTSRIHDALGKVVDAVYHKLPYIDSPTTEEDIRKMFRQSNELTLQLEDGSEANAHALADMLEYIKLNSAMHTKTSLKSLKDRFTKAPYGFIDDDVEWLAARLFKRGEITLTINGITVTTVNKNTDELVRYFTKKEYVEKLLTVIKEKPAEKDIKSVRELIKELFGAALASGDEETLMRNFQSRSRDLLDELRELESWQKRTPYPGLVVVQTGKTLLNEARQIEAPLEFFRTVASRRDDFYDFLDDYEPVKAFFYGEQKDIFDKALETLAIYEHSRVYIADPRIEELANAMRVIVTKERPYSDIPKLPALRQNFNEAYSELLDQNMAPVLQAIADDRERITTILAEKPYHDQYAARFKQQFDELTKQAEGCNNITTLRSYRDQSDALKLRLLNVMDQRDRELAAKPEPVTYVQGSTGKTPPTKVAEPPAKQKKNIGIQTVTRAASWRIESAADVDHYLEQLRERLLLELDEQTIINIEF